MTSLISDPALNCLTFENTHYFAQFRSKHFGGLCNCNVSFITTCLLIFLRCFFEACLLEVHSVPANKHVVLVAIWIDPRSFLCRVGRATNGLSIVMDTGVPWVYPGCPARTHPCVTMNRVTSGQSANSVHAWCLRDRVVVRVVMLTQVDPCEIVHNAWRLLYAPRLAIPSCLKEWSGVVERGLCHPNVHVVASAGKKV